MPDKTITDQLKQALPEALRDAQEIAPHLERLAEIERHHASAALERVFLERAPREGLLHPADALKLEPLAETMALGMSGPIFLTALSVPLLGERVGLRRWSAVIVGFIGVLVMVRPGSGVFQPAALIAIAGAFCYALAMVSIRRLSRSEPAPTIVFYFTLFAAIVGLLTWPLAPLAPAWLDPWVRPDLEGWAVLVGIGLIGGTAQLTMTYAFKLAPVAVIAPFEYGGLLIAVVYGLAIWNEVPDVYILLGAAIVIASGLYILYREAKLRRSAARSEPAV